MTGILSLPRELREEIYTYIVDTLTSNITLVEDLSLETRQQKLARCRRLRKAAVQPAISLVNQEIRAEVLPLFYKRNVFLVELSDSPDLEIAKKWLLAIGDANVRCLEWLTLCGWGWFSMRACMGRRTKYSVWVKVRFGLMRGELEVDGEDGSGRRKGTKRINIHAISQRASTMRKDVSKVRKFYQSMMEERRREGKAFNAESLSALMDFFHAFCREHCLGNLS